MLLCDTVGKGHIEHRVVQCDTARIVVEDLHAADLRRRAQQRRTLVVVLHQQAHAEILVLRSVFLRAEVADIDLKARNQLQHRLHRAGHVLELKLDEHDVAEIFRIGKISQRAQLPGGLCHGFFFALGLDKEHMHVHGLVIADARDIEPQRGKHAAGSQKRPDLVGHHGSKGLFHRFPFRGIAGKTRKGGPPFRVACLFRLRSRDQSSSSSPSRSNSSSSPQFGQTVEPSSSSSSSSVMTSPQVGHLTS